MLFVSSTIRCGVLKKLFCPKKVRAKKPKSFFLMEICFHTSGDVIAADKTQVVIVRSVSASRHHNNELVKLQLCYSDTKELVGDFERIGCLTSSPVSGKDCESGVYFRTSSTEAGKEAVFNVKIHALSSQHENRTFCFKAFVNGFAPTYSGSLKH